MKVVGDEQARELTGQVLARMTSIIVGKNGRIAAELGDELMCFFTQAGDAAAASCELHSTIGDEFPNPVTGNRMRLRIGIHNGAVAGNKDDLMRETGKIAHWAASNAEPDQTLAIVSVIDALPRIFRAVSRYVDDETWNFVTFEHVTLYEIIWDVEAVTVMDSATQVPTSRRSRRVTFTLGGDSVSINAERPVISVGRGTQNDLIVKHDLVSRQHFTAQFSRGRCTVTDKSTNGTVVIPDQGERQTIHRETAPIVGSGFIVMGVVDANSPAITLRYECV
ncbi:MAG: FHA domain-containing protein [Gammaproteobacteria bacterium]|nr:FHA domain-containing protein [Gammaproteobacteria bacterium]